MEQHEKRGGRLDNYMDISFCFLKSEEDECCSVVANNHYPNDPITMLYDSFTRVCRERVQKNEQIYEHYANYKKSRIRCHNFISNNPFPDNGCRLVFYKMINWDSSCFKYASEAIRNEREFALRAVMKRPNNFQYLNEDLKRDRTFILEVVKKRNKFEESILKYCDPTFQDDEQIVKLSLNRHPLSIIHVSERFQNDLTIATEVVKNNYRALEYIKPDIQLLLDRQLILQALATGNEVLGYLTLQLQKDKEICYHAVKFNRDSFKYISKDLHEKEFLLQLVKLDGDIYPLLPDIFKKDRDIFVQALKAEKRLHYSSSIETYAKEFLKNDKDLLLEAITKEIGFIHCAPDDMQNNAELILNLTQNVRQVLFLINSSLPVVSREFIFKLLDQHIHMENFLSGTRKLDMDQRKIVMEIAPDNILHFRLKQILKDIPFVRNYILHSPEIWKYLVASSPELKSDREFIEYSFKVKRDTFKSASNELRSDREIVEMAIEYDFTNFKYIGSDALKDEFIHSVIHTKGSLLRYCSPQARNEKQLVLQAIKHTKSNIMKYIPNIGLKCNRDFILEYAKRIGVLKYIPYEFQVDREIVLLCLQQNGEQYKNIPSLFKLEKELALVAIRNGCSLKYLNEEFRNDKEIVFESVRILGKNLKYASDEMKKDEEIIMRALLDIPTSNILQYASDEFKNNDENIKKILKKRSNFLAYLHKDKINKELIMETLGMAKNRPTNLLKSLRDFKHDRDVVLKVIQFDNNSTPGESFEYACTNLKSTDRELLSIAVKNGYSFNEKKEIPGLSTLITREIALDAVKNPKCNAQFFPPNIRSDREIMLQAINNKDMKNFRYASKELRNDRSFIMEIQPKMFDLLQISRQFRNDKEIVMKALETNGKSVIYLSEEWRNEFKNNKEMIMKAIKTKSVTFMYASEELQHDEEFVKICVGINGLVSRYLPIPLKTNREIILKAVRTKNTFLFVSSKLKLDREIVLRAATFDGLCLEYAAFEFKNDSEIVLAAITNEFTSIQHASYELLSNEEFIAQAMDINIEILRFEYTHFGDWRLEKIAMCNWRTVLIA